MDISRAQQPDFSDYARAAEYCRGDVKRPMALDFDGRILCFDGEISPGQVFPWLGTSGREACSWFEVSALT